mmetsp:Transcript_8876/g.26027  ORF Transcript_8876/g.26027 Transcript_8876/m.26027 type:complete len:391 (+) Transcript_8876:32-1204(+)
MRGSDPWRQHSLRSTLTRPEAMTRLLGLMVSSCLWAEGARARDVIVSSMTDGCPANYSKLTSALSCRVALDILGPGRAYPGDVYQGVETDSAWPSGCYECWGVTGCSDGVWFNRHSTGAPKGGSRPICARDLEPLTRGGVLWLGDSDADFWPEPDTAAAAAPLPAFNLAVGGYTCQEVLDDGLDATLAATGPSVVVLVCGENDLASGASPESAFARFEAAVARALGAGARVVTMGTKEEPSTTALWGAYTAYDALVRGLARELAAGPVAQLAAVDVSAGFEAIGNGASLYHSDQLHLSPEGYSHWNRWVGLALGDPQCVIWRSGNCSLRVPALRSTDTSTETSTETSTGTASSTTSTTTEAASRMVSHASLQNPGLHWWLCAAMCLFWGQ